MIHVVNYGMNRGEYPRRAHTVIINVHVPWARAPRTSAPKTPCWVDRFIRPAFTNDWSGNLTRYIAGPQICWYMNVVMTRVSQRDPT